MIRASDRVRGGSAAEIRAQLDVVRDERRSLAGLERASVARAQLLGLELRILETLAVLEAPQEREEAPRERDPATLERELRALIRGAPEPLLRVLEEELRARHGGSATPALRVVEDAG